MNSLPNPPPPQSPPSHHPPSHFYPLQLSSPCQTHTSLTQTFCSSSALKERIEHPRDTKAKENKGEGERSGAQQRAGTVFDFPHVDWADLHAAVDSAPSTFSRHFPPGQRRPEDIYLPLPSPTVAVFVLGQRDGRWSLAVEEKWSFAG